MFGVTFLNQGEIVEMGSPEQNWIIPIVNKGFVDDGRAASKELDMDSKSARLIGVDDRGKGAVRSFL